MRALLGCVLGLLLCSGLGADDKKDAIDAKKLVGKWERKEKESTRIIEFAKGGEMTLTLDLGKRELKYIGTYKVDGSKVVTTLPLDPKGEDVTESLTVAKLTDVELVLKGDKGEETAFVRAGRIAPSKLVGLWETKEAKGDPGVKTKFEFTKDGRAALANSVSGIEGGAVVGTYKLKDDKVTVTAKVEGKEVVLSWTVTKLTDTEMVLKNDKGKELTLVRLKDN
jgi:uncharacterized protein (TIGR03066 family)